jgi:hypothetical protein
LDVAARKKKREDQLRRKTRHVHTEVAKCATVDGWIFKNLLWTVKYFSFKHGIKFKM